MSVISEVVIVIIVVIVLSIIFNGVEDSNRDSKIHAIPFKESIDLIDVPVVTFVNNKTKLHFLLDTGSDSSYIRREVLEHLIIKDRKYEVAPINTGGGEVSSEGIATFDITYKNDIFENDFEIADVTQIWDDITKEVGITIHGILGSRFFEKYKYHIDFENLIAYSRR